MSAHQEHCISPTEARDLRAENERLKQELEKSRWGKGMIAQMAERGAFGFFLRAKRSEIRACHLEAEARRWAQEARTQRSTVHQIYQLVTGATGEPGDWNGAEPVRDLVADRDALVAALRSAIIDLCAGCSEGDPLFTEDGIIFHASDAPGRTMCQASDLIEATGVIP